MFCSSTPSDGGGSLIESASLGEICDSTSLAIAMLPEYTTTADETIQPKLVEQRPIQQKHDEKRDSRLTARATGAIEPMRAGVLSYLPPARVETPHSRAARPDADEHDGLTDAEWAHIDGVRRRAAQIIAAHEAVAEIIAEQDARRSFDECSSHSSPIDEPSIVESAHISDTASLGIADEAAALYFGETSAYSSSAADVETSYDEQPSDEDDRQLSARAERLVSSALEAAEASINQEPAELADPNDDSLDRPSSSSTSGADHNDDVDNLESSASSDNEAPPTSADDERRSPPPSPPHDEALNMARAAGAAAEATAEQLESRLSPSPLTSDASPLSEASDKPAQLTENLVDIKLSVEELEHIARVQQRAQMLFEMPEVVDVSHEQSVASSSTSLADASGPSISMQSEGVQMPPESSATSSADEISAALSSPSSPMSVASVDIELEVSLTAQVDDDKAIGFASQLLQMQPPYDHVAAFLDAVPTPARSPVAPLVLQQSASLTSGADTPDKNVDSLLDDDDDHDDDDDRDEDDRRTTDETRMRPAAELMIDEEPTHIEAIARRSSSSSGTTLSADDEEASESLGDEVDATTERLFVSSAPFGLQSIADAATTPLIDDEESGRWRTASVARSNTPAKVSPQLSSDEASRTSSRASSSRWRTYTMQHEQRRSTRESSGDEEPRSGSTAVDDTIAATSINISIGTWEELSNSRMCRVANIDRRCLDRVPTQIIAAANQPVAVSERTEELQPAYERPPPLPPRPSPSIEPTATLMLRSSSSARSLEGGRPSSSVDTSVYGICVLLDDAPPVASPIASPSPPRSPPRSPSPTMRPRVDTIGRWFEARSPSTSSVEEEAPVTRTLAKFISGDSSEENLLLFASDLEAENRLPPPPVSSNIQRSPTPPIVDRRGEAKFSVDDLGDAPLVESSSSSTSGADRSDNSSIDELAYSAELQPTPLTLPPPHLPLSPLARALTDDKQRASSTEAAISKPPPPLPPPCRPPPPRRQSALEVRRLSKVDPSICALDERHVECEARQTASVTEIVHLAYALQPIFVCTASSTADSHVAFELPRRVLPPPRPPPLRQFTRSSSTTSQQEECQDSRELDEESPLTSAASTPMPDELMTSESGHSLAARRLELLNNQPSLDVQLAPVADSSPVVSQASFSGSQSSSPIARPTRSSSSSTSGADEATIDSSIELPTQVPVFDRRVVDSVIVEVLASRQLSVALLHTSEAPRLQPTEQIGALSNEEFERIARIVALAAEDEAATTFVTANSYTQPVLVSPSTSSADEISAALLSPSSPMSVASVDIDLEVSLTARVDDDKAIGFASRLLQMQPPHDHVAAFLDAVPTPARSSVAPLVFQQSASLTSGADTPDKNVDSLLDDDDDHDDDDDRDEDDRKTTDETRMRPAAELMIDDKPTHIEAIARRSSSSSGTTLSADDDDDEEASEPTRAELEHIARVTEMAEQMNMAAGWPSIETMQMPSQAAAAQFSAVDQPQRFESSTAPSLAPAATFAALRPQSAAPQLRSPPDELQVSPVVDALQLAASSSDRSLENAPTALIELFETARALPASMQIAEPLAIVDSREFLMALSIPIARAVAITSVAHRAAIGERIELIGRRVGVESSLPISLLESNFAEPLTIAPSPSSSATSSADHDATELDLSSADASPLATSPAFATPPSTTIAPLTQEELDHIRRIEQLAMLQASSIGPPPTIAFAAPPTAVSAAAPPLPPRPTPPAAPPPPELTNAELEHIRRVAELAELMIADSTPLELQREPSPISETASAQSTATSMADEEEASDSLAAETISERAVALTPTADDGDGREEPAATAVSSRVSVATYNQSIRLSTSSTASQLPHQTSDSSAATSLADDLDVDSRSSGESAAAVAAVASPPTAVASGAYRAGITISYTNRLQRIASAAGVGRMSRASYSVSFGGPPSALAFDDGADLVSLARRRLVKASSVSAAPLSPLSPPRRRSPSPPMRRSPSPTAMNAFERCERLSTEADAALFGIDFMTKLNFYAHRLTEQIAESAADDISRVIQMRANPRARYFELDTNYLLQFLETRSQSSSERFGSLTLATDNNRR